MNTDAEAVIRITRRWVSEVVIGLTLCPFARRVFEGGLIRYVVSGAIEENALLRDVETELRTLTAAPRSTIETTLLIHPHALLDFLDYNDFLAKGDRLIRRLRLRGIVQIASFHPNYQFADTDPEAIENFTNRSPFPMLHLLREDSITEVAADPAQLEEIPRRNIALLRRLGREEMLARLKSVWDEPS